MGKSIEPQFIYMILILPSLFGLTLVGEGLNKILKSEGQGWMSIAFGIMFIAVVIGAYLFVVGSFGGAGEASTLTPIPTLPY